MNIMGYKKSQSNNSAYRLVDSDEVLFLCRSQMASRARGGSNAFKVGVPMLGFMLGGVYVLSTFMQTHVEMKDKKVSSQSQRKFDLDQEHDAMMKKLDIDNSYQLSRIPRVEEDEDKDAQKKRMKLGKYK